MFQEKITQSSAASLFKRAVLLFVAVFGIQVFIGLVIGLWSVAMGQQELPDFGEQTIVFVITLVVFGIIWRWTGGEKLFSRPFPWSTKTRYLYHANLVLILGLIVYNGLFQSLSTIFSGGWDLFWSSFTGAAIAGIGEEAWMRGLLFMAFLMIFRKKDKPLLKTAVVTSLLFGLIHLLNLIVAEPTAVVQQVFYATSLGLLFAVIRVGYDNLWLPILLHFLFDFQPTINEPVTSSAWLELMIIFIPQALLSLVTLFHMDKDLAKHAVQENIENTVTNSQKN